MFIRPPKCRLFSPSLFQYRMAADYRDPAFLLARLADKALTSVILFTLYWGLGNDFDATNNINIVAFLFMYVLLPGYSAVSYTPAIVLDRALYMRELADGLYRPLTYLLFKLTEEVVLVSVVSPIVACYTWFAVQLQGSFVVVWLA
jgi:ATP-binding cassette, subfamily G (WHITE), member 2